MPIDLEALNKQIGGVLPGPKTERSNVYIPTKEEQNNSGYNTHYSFEDTTEDLKNKIASQQEFGDWISKVPLTFGAAVASGAAATGGVAIEASKMAGAALWTPLENFDSYMSGSNKWHSFASNYEAGNPLIDFAEGIKQMTKDWQLNYADNRTFMGKIEAFTESAINSLGEYGAIGGLTSFGAAASLAKLGIKGMTKNYTIGAIGSYVGGAHEGIINAREEFEKNNQDANMMLNKKYQKKIESLQSAFDNGEIDENTYKTKLQSADKEYQEELEYIHDTLTKSALSTIAFNTAAIGTMNLLEFNLFGNSYNLLEAGVRKLRGKSKLYDDILSPALGKNIDEITHSDLLSIEANKVKASNWTGLKSWGLGSLAEGSEETISDSIKILSEGYAQDKLNEKKLAKNYNGQNFMDKWLNYMSSPEMIETFIGGAYAGGLTQGGMRVIGKMMGKDTQEQEELMTYTRELLETQKPIKETLEKITQKGAAIDQAVKYLENKEYDKYNASISQIFNSNIINSIEKGTFNVNKAVLQNQIKENNDKISKLESEKLADTTPDLVSKKQEEIKNLKLYNENVKTGVKILENYEKTYNHYKEVYGNNKIAEIVIGKDVEIEFARNYLKQMDLTRTVEDSDSFRIRDLALKLNGKVMGDRVAKAITINDYYKAISETYKSIVNDFKLLGDDATEDDMLEMKKEIEELKEFSEIATTSFIQKEIFENSIKDNIAFKNKIDRDVDFRLKLTEESMSKELRKEIESELEDTYYAKRRKQLIVDLIEKLKKEGLSQEEVIEIEKSLKKEWVDETLIDNYNQQQIDSQTVSQSKIEDTVEDEEEEVEENINNEIVSEADIERRREEDLNFEKITKSNTGIEAPALWSDLAEIQQKIENDFKGNSLLSISTYIKNNRAVSKYTQEKIDEFNQALTNVINAKYDAELALLKGKTATKTKRIQAEKTIINKDDEEEINNKIASEADVERRRQEIAEEGLQELNEGKNSDEEIEKQPIGTFKRIWGYLRGKYSGSVYDLGSLVIGSDLTFNFEKVVAAIKISKIGKAYSSFMDELEKEVKKANDTLEESVNRGIRENYPQGSMDRLKKGRDEKVAENNRLLEEAKIINAKYDAELALLKGKTETKTKRTQAEKTSTNESINEQESIQIREELLDKLFKKDFVHLFQFKSNKQSDIQEISEKIKSLFEVLKEFFDANENLLTTDKKAIINEVNFNVFYEFAKQFESIKSKFPFIQEFENKANDESLPEEDLDALIEENQLLYDSYLELMSDLSAVKEKLASKSTKKEIKEFLTIPEDDGSDFIDDYAIKVLNFIDVITTLKEDKSNEEEVVKLIESNNEDYDSTVIYASLDPIKKNSLEKIIDDEYTTLTKLDVNNTLTSSTLEYDEASETVNGAKKKNGIVPETTKKILSGEYNGKNFVLRLESNLEIEEQPINEIDKLNEHELEKLKLMVDRLKRIYSGIEFQFATVNELRNQLPDDQKKFADKYRAVYIKNKGKIVFNINNKGLSYETAIHEIAHPLIVLIQQQNVKLYSELLDISKTLDKDNTTIQNFVLKNYFESRSEQQLTDKERLNYEHECIAHALEISGSKGITYQERLDKKTNNKKLLIIQKFRRKFEEIIKYLIKAVMKKFFKTSSILKDEKGNPAIFKGLMTNKQIEIKMSDINYDMSLDMLSDLMLSLKVKIDLSSVSENSSKEDIILGSMKEEINKIQRNKQKGC